jgi:hypothetical protein
LLNKALVNVFLFGGGEGYCLISAITTLLPPKNEKKPQRISNPKFKVNCEVKK